MKRSVALGVAWAASAVAAVGLGFLAVSLVNASASPGPSPVAAITSAAEGARASSTSSAPGSATGEYATVAGTVYADCTSGAPVLAGAPAADWWVDDSNAAGGIEFRSASRKLEVHVSCVNGSPQFSDEGLRADDGGGGTPSSTPASTSPAGATSSGHGSDDSGADDSSGRSGGGHGSDG